MVLKHYKIICVECKGDWDEHRRPASNEKNLILGPSSEGGGFSVGAAPVPKL